MTLTPNGDAGIIVGVAPNSSSLGFFGDVYRIDTSTGGASPMGTQSFYASISGGQHIGEILTWSPVNPYYTNVFTGQMSNEIHPSMETGLGAYDSSLDRILGVSPGGAGVQTPWLYSSPAAVCSPSCVGSTPGVPIGPLGVSGSSPWILDYSPTTGLLGLQGTSLYRIDTTTGSAALLVNLILPPSNDLLIPIPWEFAYDDATGKLIVAAAPTNWRNGGPLLVPAQHGLYAVDLQTGLGTLLTDQGPAITALARVDTPESSTVSSFVIGLSLIALASCARYRRQRY